MNAEGQIYSVSTSGFSTFPKKYNQKTGEKVKLLRCKDWRLIKEKQSWLSSILFSQPYDYSTNGHSNTIEEFYA